MFSTKNNILITGIKSGLGKFLYEKTPTATGLTRSNADQILKGTYDTIIHCAFNTNFDNMKKYLDDNILLTKNLCDVPHEKFIYVSSIDVYQRKDYEYSITKKMAELIVQKYSKKYLIMRCSAILGKTMRENSFLKIYRYVAPTLSLHANSTFNYILQDDIINFVEESTKNKYTGIVDFVSSTNISLANIDKMLNNNTVFGDYKYKTPNIDNSQLIKLFPQADKTSERVIEEYIDRYGDL